MQGQKRLCAPWSSPSAAVPTGISLLLPFLHSSFPVLPLSLLLLHLFDIFLLLLTIFCYGLFILSCFGFFFPKLNSVLNQSGNYFLCNFSLDMGTYRGALWEDCNNLENHICFAYCWFFGGLVFWFVCLFVFNKVGSKDLVGTLRRAPAVAGLAQIT